MSLYVTCVASGCVLTDPIAEPPALSPIAGPDVVARASQVPFTITTQAQQIAWGWIANVCPANLAAQGSAALGSVRAVNQRMFAVTTNMLGPVCLWAMATDDNGAESLVWKDVLVKNGAPIARASLVAGAAVPAMFDLYSQIRLSGASSSDPDGDELAFAWTITPPAGSFSPQVPCALPATASDLCLLPPAPGNYSVSLVVTDALGKTSDALTQTIAIAPDRAPCLRDTEQGSAGVNTLLRRWDEDVAFAVAVNDDGDPFPPRENQNSKLAFIWSFRRMVPGKPALLSPVTDYSLPSFRLPREAFVQGDEIEVRVDVVDRLGIRPQAQCATADDLCEDPIASGCLQRLTWKVRYWL